MPIINGRFHGVADTIEICESPAYRQMNESQDGPINRHDRFPGVTASKNAILRRRPENQGRPIINDDANNVVPTFKPQNGNRNDLDETRPTNEIEFDKNVQFILSPLENHNEELSGFMNDVIHGEDILEVNGENEDSDATFSSEAPMEGAACTNAIEIRQEEIASEDDTVSMLCIAMTERVPDDVVRGEANL